MPDVIYSGSREGVFKEALEFLQKKNPLPSEVYRQLDEKTRAAAFTVSGFTAVELLERFLKELEAAVEDGTTKEVFREKMNNFLEKSGYKGLNPWRTDVIFRTNLQTAYNAGHYKTMTDPTARRLRPYWQYQTAGDGQVRPEHAAMEGRVYRCDDPIWDIWYPPNGFRCRCSVVSLTKEQVKERGLRVDTIMPHEIDPSTGEAVFYWPDRGFTGNPARTVYKPDMQGIRPDLKAVYETTQREHRYKGPKNKEKADMA